MVVRKTQPLPIECVVRGYLVRIGLERVSGHGKSLRHRTASGIGGSEQAAGADLYACDKAAAGHDENIPFERSRGNVGADVAEQVRNISLEIYRRAAAYAEPRGIIAGRHEI